MTVELTVGELRQLIHEAWFSKKASEESLADKLASYAGVGKEDAQSTLDDFVTRGIDPNDLIINDDKGFDKLAAAAADAPKTKANRALETKKQAWIKELAKVLVVRVDDLMAAFNDYTNLRNAVDDAIVKGASPAEWAHWDDNNAISLGSAARNHKKRRAGPSAASKKPEAHSTSSSSFERDDAGAYGMNYTSKMFPPSTL